MNTPTPLFPVELNFSKERKNMPSFDAKMKELEKIPQEKQKNHMVGGGVGLKKNLIRYVQPHNCRLYFKFSRELFHFEMVTKNQPLEINPVVGIFPVEKPKYINNGAELQIKFKDFEVKIKKQQIEIFNKFEHKRLYVIDAGLSIEEIRARHDAIKAEKRRQSIGFLRQFISTFGGKSDFLILNEVVEVKHFDENLIPLTPKGTSWFSAPIKKVYPDDHVVEANSWENSEHLLINMALRDFAPLIADGLQEIKDRLEKPKVEDLTIEKATLFLEARESDICQSCGFQRRRCVCKGSIFKSQDEIWARLGL